MVCGEDLASVLNLVELGEREAGSVGGSVRPDLAFSNRCIAMANSSAVRRPSLSTSDNSLDWRRVSGSGRKSGRERGKGKKKE